MSKHGCGRGSDVESGQEELVIIIDDRLPVARDQMVAGSTQHVVWCHVATWRQERHQWTMLWFGVREGHLFTFGGGATSVKAPQCRWSIVNVRRRYYRRVDSVMSTVSRYREGTTGWRLCDVMNDARRTPGNSTSLVRFVRGRPTSSSMETASKFIVVDSGTVVWNDVEVLATRPQPPELDRCTLHSL